MMTPFLVLNREVAAVDLALRQASAEMHRARSSRRQRRAARREQACAADRRR